MSDSLPNDYNEKNLDDSQDDIWEIKKREKKPPVVSVPVEINYETYPQVSDGLDDFEFKNYAFLRSWRVGRCRELDVEAYKIVQNRTLCEVIRRRRNDPSWGIDDGKFTQKLVQDLLECWGIGPSKVRCMCYVCQVISGSW